LEGLKPLAFSSAYSWHKAHGSQQQVTQQSQQGSSGNPNFALSFSL